VYLPVNTLRGVASLDIQRSKAGTFQIRAVYTGNSKYAESTSEETTLEVTKGASKPFIDFGFLTDGKLTVLDFLFWGILIAAFSILFVFLLWRMVKSSMQTKTGAVR